MKTYDVIVAGVGSMGSAACYHLARRGKRVLGLEQFDLPHELGSHHGHSRMIRQSYYEHPDYVPLLQRGYQLWDELNELCGNKDPGQRIFHRTGGLYLGPRDGAIVPGALAAAREHGLDYQLLEAREVEQRFPAFRVGDGFVGFFEEDAGFIRPEKALRAHVNLACSHGAEIRTGEEILDWQENGSGVTVRTRRGMVEGGHLILTAGAWSGRMLRDLETGFSVTRQVLAWFDVAADRAGASLLLGDFPCWFIETEAPYGHYGFPMTEFGQRGFKIALHRPGEEMDDPAGERTGVSEEEIASLQGVLRKWIPDADGPLLASCTCLYTNSADGHFVLGPYPGNGNVTLAAGFSGHGYKFASVMGEVLADFACEGATPHPVEFLSPQRFA